jgi:hypothetical protein
MCLDIYARYTLFMTSQRELRHKITIVNRAKVI